MSGSTIIQDGKPVGAVTYFLANDPTTDYGSFIEIYPTQQHKDWTPLRGVQSLLTDYLCGF